MQKQLKYGALTVAIKILKLESSSKSKKLAIQLCKRTLVAITSIASSSLVFSEMDNYCHKVLSKAETNIVRALFQSPEVLKARDRCLLKEEQLKKLQILDSQNLPLNKGCINR